MKIFDFFRKKPTNVVKFPKTRLPKSKSVPPMPETRKPEVPATVFYTIGVNSESRVVFKIGNSEITMNEEGLDHLVAQLLAFKQTVFKKDTQNGESD
jgi:hypothetical protein